MLKPYDNDAGYISVRVAAYVLGKTINEVLKISL